MAYQRQLVYSCQGCTLEDDNDMVQCDTCSGWYHYVCAGPDITDDIANYPWDCERCVIAQFHLTLKNDRPSSYLRNTNETSMHAITNMDRESDVSGSIRGSPDLALQFLAAQQRLNREQMEKAMAMKEERLNKDFEIKRKFLQERFDILKQRENETEKISRPNDKDESLDVWLSQQQDLSTKQVHFDKAKLSTMEYNQNVNKLVSSTPFRVTSNDLEGIENQLSSIRIQDSSQEWNKSQSTVRPQVESKQQETLFVPKSTSKYQDFSLHVPHETTVRANLKDVSNLEGNLQSTDVALPSIVPTGLNASQIAARHVLPRDLPKFFGSPKEWPMFISSFESSTMTGGYTNAENLIRLQRCLQGKAMDSVRSILLAPENVSNVIETLRMMYGRPDLIIHSLLQQLREEQPPRLEKLETIINFALSVRNLCAVIQATRLESHMNNPYLMQEILDKLPSSMKLEWSRYKRTNSNVTMITMGNWLYDVAQAASDVVTPNINQKDKGKTFNKKDEEKPKQDRFYVAVHHNISFGQRVKMSDEIIESKQVERARLIKRDIRRLVFERMERTFDIRRKFLNGRFNILNRIENKELELSLLPDKAELVDDGVTQLRKLILNTSHFNLMTPVQFNTGKDFNLNLSTPMTSPSITCERTTIKLLSVEYHEEDILTHNRNAFQLPSQSVGLKHHERSKATNLSPGYQINLQDLTNLCNRPWDEEEYQMKPHFKYQHLGLRDVTNSGHPETSRDEIIVSKQLVPLNNVQSLFPQQTSQASITAGPGLNSTEIATRHVLPRELPKFYESPKKWPIFISIYESSTITGGYSNMEKYIRRNWITSQMLANQFWTRRVREYLPTITRRTKWFDNVKSIEVGDVVYIVDEKLKRYSWPKGIVTSVFIGKDDQVRSAVVRVHNDGKNKEYHRPTSKLAVLDITPPAEVVDEENNNQADVPDINPMVNYSETTEVPVNFPKENLSQATVRRNPNDLPTFHGSSDEWPQFIDSYENSTLSGGYSNEENFIRLKNCLRGAALKYVSNILLSPENVPMVIENMKKYYQPLPQ